MTYVLTLLVLIPFVGFLATWALGRTQTIAKWVALVFSLAQLALLTLILLSYWGTTLPFVEIILGSPSATAVQGWTGSSSFVYFEKVSWVPQLGMNYILGFDGLSAPLAWLTPLLTTLAIIFHWDEEHRPREFFALLLFLEMSLTGVFMALDFFLFFIFWELVLIPMFFLIGIWGGPNRRYAALKFLVYTHVASVVMLLSIFALYWTYSATANGAVTGIYQNTFDMTVFLEAARRHVLGTLPVAYITLGTQIPIMLGFLFGFIVKLPSFPFHTWLPDAHVEAPTGGSVLLAGVLLKMGGYGIFRIDLGMFPDAMKEMWWVLAVLGIVSMVYAAFVCLHQTDLKRLIAYSSVGHMGFVTLGAATLTTIGVEGGIFQMFNHGLITAVLFMLAGSVKHATGTREIPKLQGLTKVMPQFSLILMIGFFASLGLPGLNSFWSEFMVFLGTFGSPALAGWRVLVIIPLISIVVTAAYYVYTMQRILFGDVPKDYEHAHDLMPWERFSYAVLLVLIFAVGFLPFTLVGLIGSYTATLPSLMGVI
jgi:proton-translocating NADH-quinone oxidoreductase chain M